MPLRHLELSFPPFPAASHSAEISLDGYEFMAGRAPHGDSRWVPLDQREGKSFLPCRAPDRAHEDRASELEREIEELRNSVAYMKEQVPGSATSCSHEVPPPPVGPSGCGFSELQGHDFRGVVCDRGGGLDGGHDHHGHGNVCHQGPGCVPQGDGWQPKQMNGLREDTNYGRWRADGGSSMVAPQPWSEGSGSKADLPILASDASPLELGDWLAVCGPVLRDLSAVPARWWNLTLREAQCYYDRWKLASPLDRVQLDPKLPDELFDLQYQRTEQRGVNLLLKAIPADQQQALITARELNSTALLFRLLVRYQPGGAGEKSILLAKLTALDKAVGVSELASVLRSWRRHFSRAQEIGAVLPDGTLLLKALEPAVTQIASLDAQAAFRLAQSRLQLGVDQPKSKLCPC